ncbi:MAG: methyl-accepting chemotaxis protein [Bacteroidales bacterium]|nr:methyl-accepting chemotaxis protein [Bacteroidales bacterium]
MISIGLIVLFSGISVYYWYKNRKVIAELKSIKHENSILMQKLNLKEEESKILENEKKAYKVLAELVIQSPNAIMLMDDDGNILWINEGFSKMYEYNYSEFTRALGKNYRQTSFSPNVEERINYIKKYKLPYRYEALNITKTGKKLWTQTALVPILDDQGRICNMVTIDTDIHQRVTKSDDLVRKVDALIDSFESLRKQLGAFQHELSSLHHSIDQMYMLIEQTDQILAFIKEISEKTKILGINASIEAHMAGEHGKGFRVIANEIVNISHHTLDRIRQISDILDSIRKQQSFMLGQKEDSSQTFGNIMTSIGDVQVELRRIEHSIEEFKSLA